NYTKICVFCSSVVSGCVPKEIWRLSRQSIRQILLELIDGDPLLLPRVTVTHGHRIVDERFVVDSYTERRSDLVLAGIEFPDPPGIVIDSSHGRLQVLLDLPRSLNDLRFVLREREDGRLVRREFRLKL